MILLSVVTSGYAPHEQAAIVCAIIETLVEANRIFLRRMRGLVPEIYRSDVRYTVTESWQDIPSLLASKAGDCKSLVAWRIAEHREAGRDARVHIVFQHEEARDRMHVQLLTDGQIEDPSAVLGMV